MRCEWSTDGGNCTKGGRKCPALVGNSGDARFQPMCDGFLPDCQERIGGMTKQASWESVRDKGRAIYANGGVEIAEETPEQITAYVMSGVVEGEFPVTDGGPYEVILSKRSWDNKKNVGGWVQGFLCDCKWGFYHSGHPGAGWQGRFCSHAYATLLAANARARSDFFGDRTASRDPFVWFHVKGDEMKREVVGYDIGEYLRRENDPYGWHGIGSETRDYPDGGYAEIDKVNNDNDRWDFEWFSYDSDGYLLGCGIEGSPSSAEKKCDSYHDGSRTGKTASTFELARQLFVSLVKTDYPYVEYFVQNDGNTIDVINAADDAEAVEIFLEEYPGAHVAEEPLDISNKWASKKASDDYMPDIYYEDGAIVLDDGGLMLDDLYIDQNDVYTAIEWAIGTLDAYDFDFDEDEVEQIVRDIYETYGVRADTSAIGDVMDGLYGDGWRGSSRKSAATMQDIKNYTMWYNGASLDYCAHELERTYPDVEVVYLDSEKRALMMCDECFFELKWMNRAHSGIIATEASVDDWGDVIGASRKASTDWEPFKSNCIELEYFDLDELLDMYGAYTIESYRKLDDSGMLGVVSHHVSTGGEWWSWDTYMGYFSYGVDCGTCDSKSEGMAMCERSFSEPGFTIGASAPQHAYIMDWIDELELSDFETTPTRGEDSYELHRGDVDLYITCINYGLWLPQLSWPSDPNLGLAQSDDYFDNPHDALEELKDMVYAMYSRYGSTKTSGEDRVIYTDFNDAAAYAVLTGVLGQMSDGIWENSNGVMGYWMFLDIDGSCNIIIDDVRGTSSSWTSSGWVENKLYGKSDEEVKKYVANKVKAVCKEWIGYYGGMGWKRENDQDEVDFFHRTDGGKTEYPTVQDAYRVYDSLLGRVPRIFASRTAADIYTVKIDGTDSSLEADWNNVTVIFPDGSREVISDAYADSEYKLTGEIMRMFDYGSDEEFDELQESVWQAVNECFEWERGAYFMWEDEVYSSRKVSGYPYASYDEDSRWTSQEPGFEGEYDLEAMKAMYESTVDKSEYPEFSDWEWDATRSGFMNRVAAGDGYVGEQFFFEGVMNEIVDVRYDEYGDGSSEPTYTIIDENGDTWYATNTDLETMRYRGASKKASPGSERVTSSDWDGFVSEVEDMTGLTVDSVSRDCPSEWIYMFDSDGNEYEAEVTRYSDGEYELMRQNVNRVGSKGAHIYYDGVDEDGIEEGDTFDFNGEQYHVNRVYTDKDGVKVVEFGNQDPSAEWFDDSRYESWTYAEDELLKIIKFEPFYGNRQKSSAHVDYDWRYDVDGYYKIIGEIPEGRWVDIDGDWLMCVDTTIVALSYDFDENRWSIGAYDEGSYDSHFFDSYPPNLFASADDAIDWANEHIGWTGDFRLPHMALMSKAVVGHTKGEQLKLFSRGVRKASVGYDMDGCELRLGDSIYKADEDVWYRIKDVDKFNVVELEDIMSPYATRYVDRSELEEYALNGPSDVCASKKIVQKTAGQHGYLVRFFVKRDDIDDISVSGFDKYIVADSESEMESKALDYMSERAYRDGVEFDGFDVVREIPDIQMAIDESHRWFTPSVDVIASKNASIKQATRKFTYAEMKELEDEIEGRELHNSDRFKDGGLSYHGGF